MMKIKQSRSHGLKKSTIVSTSLMFILGLRVIQAPVYAETPPDNPPSPSQIVREGNPHRPCLDLPPIRFEKISLYDKEKDAVVVQAQTGNLHEKPTQLLKTAEASFQDFVRTGCEDYLIESILLYKNYYERWIRSPEGKHSISYATRREYSRWSERLQGWNDNEVTKTNSAYPRPKDFFTDFKTFKCEVTQEKIRVDELLRKRDRLMIPSIVGLALGLSLTIAGSILQSQVERITTSDTSCSSGGLPSFCEVDVKLISVPMLTVGIVLTLGGATGLGISLGQASKQSSPLIP